MAAPSPARVKKEKQSLAQRFKTRLKTGYFVRFHMSLILTAVIASGVLTSKLLMMAGMVYLPLRYGLAVLSSYLVFFLMVRLWVWYVSVSHWGSPDLSLGNLDLPGGGGGGGGGGSSFPGFGGGDSGGGGASAAWVEGPVGPPIQAPEMLSQSASVADSSGGGGSGFHMPDIGGIDLGDDGWWIVLLLIIFVIIIICAGGYLIWVAPDILPEAAWQVALAGGINRVVKGKDPSTWFVGIMRASVLPMLVVLLAAIALGYGAHKACPKAVKLAEAIRCIAESPEFAEPAPASDTTP